MLGKIFNRTPLWEHEDPAQRVLGIAELEPNSEKILALMADSAPQVRVAAIEKCDNLDALIERLASADEGDVAALRRRIATLLAATDESARETSLAQLVPTHLVELATTSTVSALRLAAAKKLQSAAELRAVAEVLRNKDHGVAKYAKERSDAMDAAEQRMARAQSLCAALEQLIASDQPILSAVVDLDRQFAELQPDAPLSERFAAARAQVQTRFEKEQAADRERRAWQRDFDALKAAEQSGETSIAALERARADFASLSERAQPFPDLLDKLTHSGAKTAIDLLERRLKAQGEVDEFLHELAPPVVDGARLVEFEDRWNALDAEGKDVQRQQRFDDLLSGHRRQLAEQSAQSVASQQESRNSLHALLADAESALAQGEVQRAANLRDQMRPLRAAAGELPKPTNQRLGRLSQQLGDLLRWQAFGNATQREEMCVQAENLPNAGLGIAELAKAVQALRDQWKQLDQTQAPAPRALWERFNAAAEKAYAPAAEHFATQAQQRKEALERREEFIKQAEQYAALALTNPGDDGAWQPDWKAIGHWLQKSEATWRTLGHVDRRKIEATDAKWAAAIAPLRAGARGATDDEIKQREALIERVTKLVGEDGKLLPAAVSNVKSAQADWQVRAKAHPVPRKQEQALWERFRNACNAVFATLDSEKTSRNATFNEGTSKKQALIVEYEALAKSGDEKAIRMAIAEAPKRWATTGDAGRDNERKLADKFDRSLRNLRDGLRNQERNRGAVQLEALFKLEQACSALERSLVEGQSPDETAIATLWSATEAVPPAWKQSLTARREKAERALKQGGSAYCGTLEKARAGRQAVLQDIESEAGLESAGIDSAARMQRKIAKLAQHMKTGAAAPTLREQIVAFCASAGPLDLAELDRLQTIIGVANTAGVRK